MTDEVKSKFAKLLHRRAVAFAGWPNVGMVSGFRETDNIYIHDWFEANDAIKNLIAKFPHLTDTVVQEFNDDF